MSNTDSRPQLGVEPHPQLGVDLGTLVTVAVRHRSTNPATEIPSVVARDETGFVVGDEAARIVAVQPGRGSREAKRRFGDTTPIVLDGEPIDAHELSAELLRAVTRSAGIDPASTALSITHPATWRGYKLELLREIAAAQGFTDIELISDPIAAARHYEGSGRIAAGDHVAVYDLGGTFNAAIVTVSTDEVTQIGTPHVLERLGGAEIDQLVFDHVITSLGIDLATLDRNDATLRQSVTDLRSACTAAKHQLSVESETSIRVVLPGLDTRVRVTRDEFEAALRPIIVETLQALDRAIASANLEPADLVGVILSGAGSRIPLVAEMVAGHLGRPVLNDFDPKLVIASGAASRVAPTQPISVADPTSASHRETLMSEQTKTPSDSVPGTTTPVRSTPPPPPAPDKRGPSKAAKLVGGAAAAAAAVAAGVMYGDEAVEAATGDDDQANPADATTDEAVTTDTVSDDEAFQTADQIERETDGADSADSADSMDAFDAGTATAPVAGPVGTPLGDHSAPAPQVAAQRQTPRAEPVNQPSQQPTQQSPQQSPQQPAQQPAQRSTQQRPEAAPSQVAQAEAQPIAAAAAAVRDAPAPVDVAAAAAAAPTVTPAATATPVVDTQFETARTTLLNRLEDFEAPPGTSPEDAQQLRQELIDAVERFQPAPGQSTQDALAELRDDYDQRVQDFTQDQKIDALVREAQRDNEADEPVDSAAQVGPDPAAVEIPVEIPAETAVEVPVEVPVDSTAEVEDHDQIAEVTEVAEATEVTEVAEDNDDESESIVQETLEPARQPVATADTPAPTTGSDSGETRLDIKGDQSRSDDTVFVAEPPTQPVVELVGVAASALTIEEFALVDDFDALTAVAESDSAGDDGPLLGRKIPDLEPTDTAIEVTDVRFTLPPMDERPVLTGDRSADDVLGDATYAQVVELTNPALVDVTVRAEALVEAADVPAVDPAAILIGLDQPAVVAPIDLTEVAQVEITVDLVDLAIDTHQQQISDFADDDGLAAELANDITPAAPDTLSFEP